MLMTDGLLKRGMELLRPTLEDRMRMYDETGGDWSEKPVSRWLWLPVISIWQTVDWTLIRQVDMISWLLDNAPPSERRNVKELTKRMLHVNFGAIHTSSNVSSHVQRFHFNAYLFYFIYLDVYPCSLPSRG